MYEERSGDPTATTKFRFAGGAVGICGMVYFVALVVYLAPGVWLSASSATTEAVDTRHNRWFGTEYAIRVAGAEHWCAGGDSGNGPRRGVRVAYDSAHPDRCRAAAMVGEPGPYEVVAALAASSFIAAGLGATVLWSRKTARLVSFAVAVLLGWSYVALGLVIHTRR